MTVFTQRRVSQMFIIHIDFVINDNVQIPRTKIHQEHFNVPYSRQSDLCAEFKSYNYMR